jgi:hypothetical protein
MKINTQHMNALDFALLALFVTTLILATIARFKGVADRAIHSPNRGNKDES